MLPQSDTAFTTTSHSLMHGEVVAERTGTLTEFATPLTNRIWRNACTNDGYFLDISKIVSNFLGIKFLGKNTQRCIEVYPTKDIVDRFLVEGVIYETENSKIQLFPCKAVNGEGKLIQIPFTDIPFLPETQLLQELSTAIGVFGNILDIGLNYEQSESWVHELRLCNYPATPPMPPTLKCTTASLGRQPLKKRNSAMQLSPTWPLGAATAMKRATPSLR